MTSVSEGWATDVNRNVIMILAWSLDSDLEVVTAVVDFVSDKKLAFSDLHQLVMRTTDATSVIPTNEADLNIIFAEVLAILRVSDEEVSAGEDNLVRS